MAGLECCNCGYYWQDEDDDWERCHWDYNCPFPAPCEEEDYVPADDPRIWEDENVYCANEPESEWEWDDDPNLEVGFNPYEGGYTWDC